MDKAPLLPTTPSFPAAAAAHATPNTNSQDKHVALITSTCEASLSAPLNTTSTATAEAEAVANVIARDDPRTINGVIVSTRPCQSTSSHTLPDVPVPGRLEHLTATYSHGSPGHTPHATYSKTSPIPNKRRRLSRDCSGQLPSTNHADDAQTELINNENVRTNMHVVDTSSESGSSPQPLQIQGPKTSWTVKSSPPSTQ